MRSVYMFLRDRAVRTAQRAPARVWLYRCNLQFFGTMETLRRSPRVLLRALCGFQAAPAFLAQESGMALLSCNLRVMFRKNATVLFCRPTHPAICTAGVCSGRFAAPCPRFTSGRLSSVLNMTRFTDLVSSLRRSCGSFCRSRHSCLHRRYQSIDVLRRPGARSPPHASRVGVTGESSALSILPFPTPGRGH